MYLGDQFDHMTFVETSVPASRIPHRPRANSHDVTPSYHVTSYGPSPVLYGSPGMATSWIIVITIGGIDRLDADLER